jgi:excisionase family DNA binding protein
MGKTTRLHTWAGLWAKPLGRAKMVARCTQHATSLLFWKIVVIPFKSIICKFQHISKTLENPSNLAQQCTSYIEGLTFLHTESTMKTATNPTPPSWLAETVAAVRGDRVSVVELATALDVHPWTVRRWIREGRLEAVKVGNLRRITRKAVERFLADGVSASA